MSQDLWSVRPPEESEETGPLPVHACALLGLLDEDKIRLSSTNIAAEREVGGANCLSKIGTPKDGIMDAKTSTELVPVAAATLELPPILVGRHTSAVEAQVRNFYGSVADIFERWVTRRSKPSHPAGLPAGRSRFRRVLKCPLARGIEPALHGLSR